ncbi:MAG: HIT family protein [Spirochaetaceae bacterium]|jgi:diadenosine tetraphosphate (Ap4A) HIT family hydrolase|nr:HIT family protein [Spirochaetaceae bacterium]
MKDTNCRYCTCADDISVKVADLETSVLLLPMDQTYRGRCILALNDHKSEVFMMAPDELAAWARDLSRAAKALWEVFSPDKINYAVFGDLYPHLHMHLVPKYKGGPEWGGPFLLDLSKDSLMSREDLEERAGQIRRKL